MKTAGCHFFHIWIKTTQSVKSAPPSIRVSEHFLIDGFQQWDSSQESASNWETINQIKAHFNSLLALNGSIHCPESICPHSEGDSGSLQEQIWRGCLWLCRSQVSAATAGSASASSHRKLTELNKCQTPYYSAWKRKQTGQKSSQYQIQKRCGFICALISG